MMILDMRCVMLVWMMQMMMPFAAHIIRRDMVHTHFDGSFPKGCQEDAVPKSLVALIGMVMDGHNIKKKIKNKVRQAKLLNC